MAEITTFSNNVVVRSIGQLDSIDMVPEAVVDLRRKQAYYIIYKNLKPAYKTKVDGGTLTEAEAFDLNVGEAELATAFLCKSLATKFTLFKFNRSIASGIGGGQSDRDSRKNIDFKQLIPIWLELALSTLGDYLSSIPRIGEMGKLDPYSMFDFEAVKNEDLESMSEEEEALEANWG